MSKPYSVMFDPVIPVTFLDGDTKEIGIRDVIVNAHNIADLQCQSPIEGYALLRHIVAIAMDMLRPERWMDRQKLLKKGSFNADEVDAYIYSCEKDEPRFDLFDPKHPYMQTPYEAIIDDKAIKPVANISVSLPSGNNHIFLDHRPEAVSAMTPSEAFRSMITLYLFCTAGAQDYPSGINNTPPVYTWVQGQTLYETIILNMISTKEHPSLEDGYDTVPWRSNIPVIPKEEYISVSMMEGFTWQPRRICLLQAEDGMVRFVALQQGRNFRGNELWRDPHVAYRCNKKGEWSSVKPQTGRALWRDVGTLLADSASEHHHPPLVVARAPDIMDCNTFLMIRQVGLITSNASYLEWIEDRISIPACLVVNDLLSSIIRNDAETIEFTQNVLVKCINSHFSHDTKNISEFTEQVRLSFLLKMYEVMFGFCIPDVYKHQNQLTENAILEHLRYFHKKVEKAILNTFHEVVQASGSLAKDIQLQVETQIEVINIFRKNAREREKNYE